jgi:hypothetical protein
MMSHFVGSAYLLLSAVIILLLAHVSQKPLCINSQTIEKMTMTDESVVYRCGARKRVSYTKEFADNQLAIESKIIPFENWLNQNWNMKAPRVSVMLTKNPAVTQLLGQNILIWEHNLFSTQQLEVEIAKNYLYAMNPSFFSENDLALNSLSDFVVKVWLENQSLDFGGLPSYIAHQWWIAYSELRINDQLALIRKIPRIMKLAPVQTFLDPETKTYEQVVELAGLFSKEESFYSLLKSRNTFEENSLTASFDYLILMPQVRSNLFKSLGSIQEQSPFLNLGIWDGKSLYHVGSKSQIEAKAFNKLKVGHLIWESCDDLELKDVLGVSADVQKLLVIKNCSPQNQPDYTEYISKGIAGFAATHPQITFVQIDMPSLNMKRDSLSLQEKIFELMTQQAVEKESKGSFLSLFGLEQLNWNHELQMYVPKAQIDAVESFRIIKQN